MSLAMNYLERLLRRALAVPGAAPQDVFDPFDQTAPWLLEATVAEGGSPVVSAPAQGMRTSPAGAPDVPFVAPPLHPPSAPADSVAVRLAPAAADPPAKRPAPLAADVTAPPAADPVAVPRTVQPEPLARADAFMQSLGAVQVPTPDAGAPRAAAVPATLPQSEPLSAPRAVRGANAPQHAVLPPLRPPAPPQLPPPAAAPAAARPRAVPAAARAAAAPANAPRLAAAAPRERIVQTTVFVSPAPRALDELAHSSGIARFGIGQG